MVSQLRALVLAHKVWPISDAGRLHPGGSALHVTIAEPTALPVDDPRPRGLRPSALARRAMCATPSLEGIAAYLARERRLHSGELSRVFFLKASNLPRLTRNVLCEHRVSAFESETLQIVSELVLLVIKLATCVDDLRRLLRAK